MTYFVLTYPAMGHFGSKARTTVFSDKNHRTARASVKNHRWTQGFGNQLGPIVASVKKLRWMEGSGNRRGLIVYFDRSLRQIAYSEYRRAPRADSDNKYRIC